MPTVYVSPLGRLGNNILQYMAARLVCRAFGHTLVRWKSDCQDSVTVTDCSEGPYGFSWEWFREFVGENGIDGSLRGHPLGQRNIHLSGYFQQSDVYIQNRYWLRSLFTIENKDWLNLSTRVCDLMAAEQRVTGAACVHLRLGDFQVSEERSFILDPSVFLQAIRGEKIDSPLHLVAAAPRTPEERMYFALFDDVRAQWVAESELEDHATLRSAKTLFCSNSTFAWTAAFLGRAEKIWMPRIRGFSAEQNLGVLPGAVELPERFVFLREFSVGPSEVAFCGEDLEALCDCIVLNKEKEDYHGGLEHLVPRSKWVFLEELDTQKLASAQVVFLYEDLFADALPQILEELKSVRLLVLHNADTEPCAEKMRIFLERWPAAHIYAQNNSTQHPRIHCLPMGIQNRMWRQGDLEVCAAADTEKQYLALASHFAATHPVRAELVRVLTERPFEGLFLSPRCSQQDYFRNLLTSAFSFCPPGNAHDTHRLWESLFCGSIPIVHAEPFIECLLETIPSLPLFVVKRFEEVTGGVLEEHLRGKKYRFDIPPCLYLKFWSLLFNSYRYSSCAF